MSGGLILLSLVNALHLAATVIWIGAIVTNTFVLMPAAAKALEPPALGRLLGVFMKRFRPLVYTCVVTLVVTGVIMMLQNRHYDGMLNLKSLWAQLLLVKHVAIVVMIVLVVYAFEVMAPAVGKLAAAGPSPALAAMQKKQMAFAKIGMYLAFLVLLLTSIITAISSLP